MKEYTVTLPYPPSTNNLFINLPRGGRVVSKRYAAWKIEAQRAIKRASGPRFNEPVAVSIVFGKPDNRRRDLDNALKAPLDALVHMHVITDDSLIHKISAEWGDAEGAAVTIRALNRGA